MKPDHGALIASKHGLARSNRWRTVMHAHLRLQPICLACGVKHRSIKVNVHHRFPFHYVLAVGRPDLELDQRNLYTMCVEHDEEHHLLIGHLGNYESYNPNLEHYLPLCRGLLASQIRSLKTWQDAVTLRPKPLHEMTQHDKRSLRAELDRLMPAV